MALRRVHHHWRRRRRPWKGPSALLGHHRPHVPARCLLGRRPLPCAPERSLSRLHACRGAATWAAAAPACPPAAPKLRILLVRRPGTERVPAQTSAGGRLRESLEVEVGCALRSYRGRQNAETCCKEVSFLMGGAAVATGGDVRRRVRRSVALAPWPLPIAGRGGRASGLAAAAAAAHMGLRAGRPRRTGRCTCGTQPRPS